MTASSPGSEPTQHSFWDIENDQKHTARRRAGINTKKPTRERLLILEFLLRPIMAALPPERAAKRRSWEPAAPTNLADERSPDIVTHDRSHAPPLQQRYLLENKASYGVAVGAAATTIRDNVEQCWGQVILPDLLKPVSCIAVNTGYRSYAALYAPEGCIPEWMQSAKIWYNEIDQKANPKF